MSVPACDILCDILCVFIYVCICASMFEFIYLFINACVCVYACMNTESETETERENEAGRDDRKKRGCWTEGVGVGGKESGMRSSEEWEINICIYRLID